MNKWINNKSQSTNLGMCRWMKGWIIWINDYLNKLTIECNQMIQWSIIKKEKNEHKKFSKFSKFSKFLNYWMNKWMIRWMNW